MTPPNRRRVVWFTLLGIGTAYEIHEVRDHDNGYPLTWMFRWVFHTHHPAGRAVFLCLFGWFASWFVPHVLSDAVVTAAVQVAAAPAARPRERRFTLWRR